jgi:hypothetical protein
MKQNRLKSQIENGCEVQYITATLLMPKYQAEIVRLVKNQDISKMTTGEIAQLIGTNEPHAKWSLEHLVSLGILDIIAGEYTPHEVLNGDPININKTIKK